MSIKEHITGIFAGAAANDERFVVEQPRLDVPAQVLGAVFTPAGQHLLQTESRDSVYASEFVQYFHDLIVESTLSAEGIESQRNKVINALQSLEEQIAAAEEKGSTEVAVFDETSVLYNSQDVLAHSAAFFNSIDQQDVAEMVDQVAHNIEAAHQQNWVATPSHKPNTLDAA